MHWIRNRKASRLAFLAAVLAVSALSAAEPSVLRVYYIGNSVTDTVRYGESATKDGTDAHVIECLRFQCAIDGSRASWKPRN